MLVGVAVVRGGGEVVVEEDMCSTKAAVACLSVATSARRGREKVMR